MPSLGPLSLVLLIKRITRLTVTNIYLTLCNLHTYIGPKFDNIEGNTRSPRCDCSLMRKRPVPRRCAASPLNDFSTTSMPKCLSTIAAAFSTTHSFCAGANVHVEYTTVPPTFAERIAFLQRIGGINSDKQEQPHIVQRLTQAASSGAD